MTRLQIFIYVLGLFISSACSNSPSDENDDDKIWFSTPAKDWNEALPIGNGRFGAMVFGDPVYERIQLNEDSLWPGGPEWENSKGTPKDLKEIRSYIKSGKLKLADSLIVERFSFKDVTRSHQTLGDLFIDFENKPVDNYQRELNLSNAVVTTSYKKGGFQITQEIFSSIAEDVIIVKIATDNPKGIDYNLSLSRPEDHGHKTVTVSSSENMIRMEGEVTQFGAKKNSIPVTIDHGVQFETVVQVHINSGSIESSDGGLQLQGVKEAILYVVCNTSFYHDDYRQKNKEALQRIEKIPFQKLLANHIKEYQNLYNRCSIDLGHDEKDSIAMEKRLEQVQQGHVDVGLAEKLFQYGRYLLISSSQPGTNPANLQGIWNEHIEAPWNADYHLNINLEMNYWLADMTNLSECNEPLFDFTDRIVERAKIIAKDQYGMEGAMIHHTTDLWGTPWMRARKPYWGSWIHGGGWMAQHYWEHFRFTRDTTFLKARAYPFIKDIATFYNDWLEYDPETDTYISYPETSPENSYISSWGDKVAVAKGTAMGYQIINEVFENYIETAEILGYKDALIDEIKKKQQKLSSGITVGNDGRLLEWSEAFEEPEKGHRHISHLYALHPGDAITASRPELFDAAKKTITYRLEHGGAGTGWSRAWTINFYARLQDADAVEEHINLFMERSLYGNLFDKHPPFQIDGNFGFTAGVTEALLQSHEGFLRILPALPTGWKTGRVKGIKARGNIEVNIHWENDELQRIELRSPLPKTIDLKYGNLETTVDLPSNKVIVLDNRLE